MTSGFQPDELKEHAYLTELAVLVRQWEDAETSTLAHVRSGIDSGVRASVICDHLGISRATLYRWFAA